MATVGPASDTESGLRDLLGTGLDAVRLNMSQGDQVYYAELIQRIRRWASGERVGPAILIDLAGPKIRTVNYKPGWQLTTGERILLGRQGAVTPDAGIPLTGEFRFREIHPGATISADDGKILLDVTAHISEDLVEVTIRRGGDLKPRKGVNFINLNLDVPTLTDKDASDFEFALDQGIDWVALSFVRSGADMDALREIMTRKGKTIPVLAKIEKPEALNDLDQILEKFDGIMVARGDLGVEVPLERLPAIQKLLIRRANLLGKPVVIATQLLATMQDHPYPTRAEVTDVANAVYDGADALLLTGETAIGSYPVETVNQMAGIIAEVEKDPEIDPRMAVVIPQQTDSDAIARAAGEIADVLRINVIVSMTHSGATALAVAKYRPHAAVYAMTPFLPVARRMKIIWGLRPVIVEPYQTTDAMLQLAERRLLELDALETGDSFVVSAGLPIGRPGTTNMLKIQQVSGNN